MTRFTDREQLYRVVSDGEEFYVRANSFAEAEKKFIAWEAPTYPDGAGMDIESISQVGSLIREDKARE